MAYFSDHFTGWPKKVSYCTLTISLLNIDHFSQLFTSRLCKKNCYSVAWHHIYCVATRYVTL